MINHENDTTTLSKAIQHALQDMHIDTLRPHQRDTLKAMRDRRHIVLLSPTGSGKTLAFGLGSLSLIQEELPFTQILVLCPTRNLALQTTTVFQQLTLYTKTHVVCLIGGQEETSQYNALRQSPHIVIGTLGRIQDWIAKKALALDHLKYVILDEFDAILMENQGEMAQRILDVVTCPTFYVSATISKDIPIEPNTCILQYEKTNIPDTIQIFQYPTTNKEQALYELLEHTPITKVMIFANTKQDVHRLSQNLIQKGYLAQAFTANLSQNKRNRILQAFKDGQLRILVSSDVGARGLDIAELSHVIHYDLPDDNQTFFHRTGRSGHQGDRGTVIILNDTQTNLDYPFFTIPNQASDLKSPLVRQKETKTEAMVIFIRAGKKDKLRIGDILGAFSQIVDSQDIGKIEVQDTYSTVVLFHTIPLPTTISIKGKPRKIEPKRKLG